MEHAKQQNPERQQWRHWGTSWAPVPKGRGEEKAAGGDPQQCERLWELLLLREAATSVSFSLTDGPRWNPWSVGRRGNIPTTRTSKASTYVFLSSAAVNNGLCSLRRVRRIRTGSQCVYHWLVSRDGACTPVSWAEAMHKRPVYHIRVCKTSVSQHGSPTTLHLWHQVYWPLPLHWKQIRHHVTMHVPPRGHSSDRFYILIYFQNETSVSWAFLFYSDMHMCFHYSFFCSLYPNVQYFSHAFC